MLQSLDVLDRAIAETEIRVGEQALLVLWMEQMGQDAGAAKRILRVVEALLVEYRRARVLAAGPPAPASERGAAPMPPVEPGHVEAGPGQGQR